MATPNSFKTPQDHKAPVAEPVMQSQMRFSEVEGSELLRPFSEVRGSDQLRLLGRLKGLGLMGDDEDATVGIDDLDFDAVADLIDYVGERFAIDQRAFEHFTMGAGGFERAMNLAVAYAGELGNAEA